MNSNIKNIIRIYLLPDMNYIKLLKSKCLKQLQLNTYNIYVCSIHLNINSFKRINHNRNYDYWYPTHF